MADTITLRDQMDWLLSYLASHPPVYIQPAINSSAQVPVSTAVDSNGPSASVDCSYPPGWGKA